MANVSSPARSPRFWGIFAALCLLAFVSALDVSIITTALPTITTDIGGASQYVWIANSFVVASCVDQPLFGQLADLLGRRLPLIVSTALFTLGSGVAGGAHNPAMLIAGRTVQGLGAGGMYVLLDIVCADLVPLRERGKYLGLMFSWAGLASALGPVVGGALAEANWRWIFYLNIPICGAALGLILLFMRVKKRNPSATTASSSNNAPSLGLDYLGLALFIPSMISLLLGLIRGGVEEPWSSWRIVVPLVLGILGWIAFHIQQYFTTTPSVPPRLFTNRTSATAYLLTFVSSVLVQAQLYFLPIYFQAVKGMTVLRSGVCFLPFAIGTLVFAVLSGTLLSIFGEYMPLHALSFALSAVAFGLFTLLDSSTSTVAWVFIELTASAGAGLIMSVLLPAIMAALPESDVALSTAAYSFVRTFGYVWGVTIASVIFNAVIDANIDSISSPGLQSQVSGAEAYSFASQAHRIISDAGGRAEAGWDEVAGVYTKALKVIWWAGLGISLAGLLAVGMERRLELRKELETEYGIDDSSNKNTNNDDSSGERGGEKEKGSAAPTQTPLPVIDHNISP
ncbi:major facilitator superfamily domain-containing protein [Aspergillus undulatus]|uniref:major facilitator superfamily domain-containing protein n=1 Tax=Aspergillus undulatus TaxID=1810928 RepID=UPI003CCE1516